MHAELTAEAKVLGTDFERRPNHVQIVTLGAKQAFVTSGGADQTAMCYRFATQADLEAVKWLHCQLLPIPYPDDFYPKLSCCILCEAGNGKRWPSAIGVISSRTTDENLGVGVDARRFLRTPSYQYIATFGVLEPYRAQGVGSELLQVSALLHSDTRTSSHHTVRNALSVSH